ncbi:MAG: DUF2380 domain-containing protein [Chloroflexi bacterium]|nr:DUF2380 domain-containing protein [Chloroflexota bacterium]
MAAEAPSVGTSTIAVAGGVILIGHGATVGGGILVRNLTADVNQLLTLMAGQSSERIERHHLLPRQFRDKFERAGLDIEDYTVDLSFDLHKDIHGRGGGEAWINSWNRQWTRFFQANPYPSASEILRQLTSMKLEFGIP